LDEPPSQTVFTILYILAAVEFLVGSFFSAARTSLFTMDRTELPLYDDSVRGNKGLLARMLRRPARLVIGVGIGELSGHAGALAFGAVAAAYRLYPLQGAAWLYFALALLGLALFILLFGKVLSMHYLGTPEFAVTWAPLMSFLLAMLSPMIWITEKLAFTIGRPEEFLERAGASQLDLWTENPEEDAELEREEKEMIRSIYEFGETTAREIMTPRTYLQAISADTPGKKVIEFIAQSSYSRFPVYEGSLDNVIGVLHVKDMFKAFAGMRPDEIDLRKICREPYIVPETKKLDELLQEIKENRKQMAIVIDEYGGLAGVVTLEDILEEIVGEIQDEYDDEVKLIIRLDDGSYLLSARMSTEEMNEELHTNIENEDFDTLGGLVFSCLGRIPAKGDSFRYEGWDFSVLSVSGNRVGMVRVSPSPQLAANLERGWNGARRKEQEIEQQ
jgi:putative hemolysin